MHRVTVTTPTDRDIAITRVFDAPKRLVFQALTRPDLVKRWLTGPAGWSMIVCDVDLKIGGAYRYEWRAAGKADIGLSGVFLEIVQDERLSVTEIFDQAWYPGEAVTTTVLVERAGMTTLTATSRYDSREVRDAVLKSGATDGLDVSYDHLDELLAASPPHLDGIVAPSTNE